MRSSRTCLLLLQTSCAQSALPWLPCTFGRALGCPYVERGGTLDGTGTADPIGVLTGVVVRELLAGIYVCKIGGCEQRRAAIVCCV